MTQSPFRKVSLGSVNKGDQGWEAGDRGAGKLWQMMGLNEGDGKMD